MIPAEHPYLSVQAHFRYGRVHPPVTPRYNIRYGYYDHRYDYANESRPDVTSEVISPETAPDRVERTLCLDSRLRVVGVTGPGESLANPTTLETLRLTRVRFFGLLLYLSISGLVLSDILPGLLDCGVPTLTVIVNTRSVVCAGHAYRTVGGSADAGATAVFLYVQQEGMAKTVKARSTMRINTAVIPGVNTGEVKGIACWVAHTGAATVNLMSLIPQADFRGCEPPSRALPEALRIKARIHIPQFIHCG